MVAWFIQLRNTMLPSSIASDEILGRCVFDSKKADRLSDPEKSLSSSQTKSLFSPPPGKSTVSVDRLYHCDCSDLTAIHDQNAKKRSGRKFFHGWLVCRASVYQNLAGQLDPSRFSPKTPAMLKSNLSKDTLLAIDVVTSIFFE